MSISIESYETFYQPIVLLAVSTIIYFLATLHLKEAHL